MLSSSKTEFIQSIHSNALSLLSILQSQVSLKKQYDIMAMGPNNNPTPNTITDADILAAFPNGTSMTANELSVFITKIANISDDAMFNDLFILTR